VRKKAFSFFSCPFSARVPAGKSAFLKFNRQWPFSLVSWLSRGRVFLRGKICSITREEIEGYFFSSCLCESKDKILNESSLIDRLTAIEEISLKNGAGILGVDIAGDPLMQRWGALCAKLKIPVTTGKSLLAWSAYEAIYRASRLKRIDLQGASLGVVGISDLAAALCSKKLAEVVKRMVIFDDDRDRLKRLYGKILQLSPQAEISMADSAAAAGKGCDIVVLGDTLQDESLYPDSINPGGIICNILHLGAPLDKRASLRGASMINAGLVRLPPLNDFRLPGAFAANIVSASMAETMLLALEGLYFDYSAGEDTNIEKMEEIADMAARHGFEIWVPEAPLYI
jgi:predicted amino acid dehydrogenase